MPFNTVHLGNMQSNIPAHAEEHRRHHLTAACRSIPQARPSDRTALYSREQTAKLLRGSRAWETLSPQILGVILSVTVVKSNAPPPKVTFTLSLPQSLLGVGVLASGTGG